jgi:hypothetical protein
MTKLNDKEGLWDLKQKKTTKASSFNEDTTFVVFLGD